MSQNAVPEWLARIGITVLVLMGLWWILRGIFTGLIGSSAPLRPPEGVTRGVAARTLASLLSVAVLFKFFFETYTQGVYPFQSAMGLAVFTLFAMALVPFVETLVTVAALFVFLADNTVVFGQGTLITFAGLFLFFSIVRWLLGR